MNRLIVLIAFCALSISVWGQSTLNSKQSLKLCKQNILADVNEGAKLRFGRKAATSTKRARFVHRLNALKTSENGKEQLKVTCEITRSGEILTVRLAAGRWNL